jgi:hypothetical protein
MLVSLSEVVVVVAANNVELIKCLQILAFYGQGRAFARFAVG